MNVFSAIMKASEYRARRKTLAQLRAMTDRSLLDCNLSPELVREGMKGWPWRYPAENTQRHPLQRLLEPTATARSVEHGMVSPVTDADSAPTPKQNDSVTQENHRTAA